MFLDNDNTFGYQVALFFSCYWCLAFQSQQVNTGIMINKAVTRARHFSKFKTSLLYHAIHDVHLPLKPDHPDALLIWCCLFFVLPHNHTIFHKSRIPNQGSINLYKKDQKASGNSSTNHQNLRHIRLTILILHFIFPQQN